MDLYADAVDVELDKARSLVGKVGRVKARDHTGEYIPGAFNFGRRRFTCERVYRQDKRWLMMDLVSVDEMRCTVYASSFELLETAAS
jgi:hypothetical protein